MTRLPPRSTGTHTLLPATTHFRSFIGGRSDRTSSKSPTAAIASATSRKAANRSRSPSISKMPGHAIAEESQRDGAEQVEEHERRRSEEHTSELQSLMRSSYAVFCLKKKTRNKQVSTEKAKDK